MKVQQGDRDIRPAALSMKVLADPPQATFASRVEVAGTEGEKRAAVSNGLGPDHDLVLYWDANPDAGPGERLHHADGDVSVSSARGDRRDSGELQPKCAPRARGLSDSPGRQL